MCPEMVVNYGEAKMKKWGTIDLSSLHQSSPAMHLAQDEDLTLLSLVQQWTTTIKGGL